MKSLLCRCYQNALKFNSEAPEFFTLAYQIFISEHGLRIITQAALLVRLKIRIQVMRIVMVDEGLACLRYTEFEIYL